ncbi:hypothetical protein AGMMS49940_06960 [Spirochaetia bacterium]|nr:hypothetical protein AGMMS49940_06960 [Spirochaetia bacterium]
MKNDDGFTLMETLTALALVSLIMTIIALALSSAAGVWTQSRDRALFAVRLLRADSLVRSRIGAVAIPYWETPVLLAADSSVTIPWFEGERSGFVRLRAEDDRLIMETGEKRKTERIVLLSGLEGTELSILRDERHIPGGIGVTYFHKQKSYHTRSAFASFPIRRGNP